MKTVNIYLKQEVVMTAVVSIEVPDDFDPAQVEGEWDGGWAYFEQHGLDVDEANWEEFESGEPTLEGFDVE